MNDLDTKDDAPGGAFPASTAVTPRSGDWIAGRYRVIQGPRENPRLEGGMGLVFLCIDQEMDAPVALKTFKPEHFERSDTRHRFLREAAAWVSIPPQAHVVRAHRVERSGDGTSVWIVLEWVAAIDGCTTPSLRERLAVHGPLDHEQVLPIALQIARGMKHVTTSLPGFVHRDLKPENILLGRDGLARVTDFGLIGADAPESASHALGTPQYMAPEQFVPRGNVDCRADIYSLGCVLFELCTGRPAIESPDRETAAAAHRRGDALQAIEELPANVAGIARRCVVVDPRERYASWEQVETALRAMDESAGESGAAATEEIAERALAWSWNAVGSAYLDLGRGDLARPFFERAGTLARQYADKSLECAALTNLGSAFVTERAAREAIAIIERALPIAEALGEIPAMSDALRALATAHDAAGDPSRAIAFASQARATARRCRDLTREALSLIALARAHRKRGDAQWAATFSAQASAIARRTGNRRIEMEIQRELPPKAQADQRKE